MANIVPFNENLPATLANRKRLIDVNKDIVTTAPFGQLSIKGKVFTLVQDSERKILTKPDDPDEVVQSVAMVFLRINMKSKTFYKKRFTEDDSEGQRPDCYSNDGVTPSPNSPDKQAEKCTVCPHNVFGTALTEDGGTGKGKRCGDHARIAVADPKALDKPLLLRVPPASLKPLKEDALKPVKVRGVQYNEVVFKVSFDKEIASPKLVFKPIGVLDDATYSKACEMFDSEIVRAIVGLDEAETAAGQETPAVEASELDAALQAREVVRAAKAPPAPTVDADELEQAVAPPAPAPKPAAKKAAAPKPAPAPAPAPAAKPAPVAAAADDDLLGDLDSLLGATDD